MLAIGLCKSTGLKKTKRNKTKTMLHSFLQKRLQVFEHKRIVSAGHSSLSCVSGFYSLAEQDRWKAAAGYSFHLSQPVAARRPGNQTPPQWAGTWRREVDTSVKGREEASFKSWNRAAVLSVWVAIPKPKWGVTLWAVFIWKDLYLCICTSACMYIFWNKLGWSFNDKGKNCGFKDFTSQPLF